MGTGGYFADPRCLKPENIEKTESREGELTMKKLLAVCLVIALVAFAAPAFATVNSLTDLLGGNWVCDALSQISQSILEAIKACTPGSISLF